MKPKIIKKQVNRFGATEFWFDNDTWCSIDTAECPESYEYQPINDADGYIEGSLEYDADSNTLEGYDGCFELPAEVVIACKDCGVKISKFIENDAPETQDIPSELTKEEITTKTTTTMKTKSNKATSTKSVESESVMNLIIVRLNEMKSVKMTGLKKDEKPIAKFNKEVATYLLKNWDDLKALKTCLKAMRKDMPEGGEEVMKIYDGRISELNPPKPKKTAEPKKVETAKPTTPAKSEEKQPKHKVGDLHDNGKWVWKEYKPGKFDWRAISDTRGAVRKHKVGDIHDNGLWIWLEYAPGKFDWKSKNGKRAQEWFKAQGRTDMLIQEQKPAPDAKTTKKQKEKKTAKKGDAKEASQLTLEQILAKPTPKGLTKPQSDALKALRKGYRLRKEKNAEAYWLTISSAKATPNIRVEIGTMEALMRKYGIDYLPAGIWF